MMSCQQATRRIAGERPAGDGWRARLSIRLHLWMCRSCRCYKAQLAAIGDVTRGLYGRAPGPSANLEQAILERCLECQPKDPPE